ncbi:MAG TPA: amidase family protein, partial [Myxococcota bacterium]|nr:amidase family protein [Myxococcota bacterium]
SGPHRSPRARGERWGPLHGLPITIKENLALPGTPQTVGVRARASRPGSTTAPVVEAALSAGAIVLGKTNVPQLLLAMETHNDIWGTTHNPWDLGRSPGGSSGGEGAAIAAGMSPLGIGTDIGGSIRIPAAWCGVCGVKPTYTRWSMAGIAAGQPGQEAVRSQCGPMARTVADLLLMFRVVDPVAQHALDPVVPPVPLGEPPDVRGLRVGVFETDGVFQPSPSVVRAVREAADALRAAGAEVVPWEPPRGWDMFETYFGLMTADGAITARAQIGDEPVTPQLRSIARMAALPAFVRRALAAGAGLGHEPRVKRLLGALGEKRLWEVWRLVVRREELKRAELAAWRAAGLQAVVGPPTVTPPALLGETHDWSAGAWYTMRYNLLDMPAGVVPVTTAREDEQGRGDVGDRLDRKAARFEAGSAGLPVAAQVIGLPWQERVVLEVMRVIEAGVRDRDGFPRTPIDPRGG